MADSQTLDTLALEDGLPSDSSSSSTTGEHSGDELETSSVSTEGAETTGVDTTGADNEDSGMAGSDESTEVSSSETTASETTSNTTSEETSSDEFDLSESDSSADLSLVIEDSPPSPAVGGVEGAFHFMTPCPPGHILSGMEGIAKPEIRTLRGLCAPVTYVPGQTELDIGEPVALDWKGNATGEAQRRVCPTNTAVIRFTGRADRWVGALALDCAPLHVEGDGEGWQVTPGEASPLTIIGQSELDAFAPIGCPEGGIAAGLEGDAAIVLDTFQVTCRTLSLE